jgi:hypothetical protein
MQLGPPVHLRRALDRSLHRKPLRLTISRRAAPRHAGVEEFVTQVRFGNREAVLVPWDEGPEEPR